LLKFKPRSRQAWLPDPLIYPSWQICVAQRRAWNAMNPINGERLDLGHLTPFCFCWEQILGEVNWMTEYLNRVLWLRTEVFERMCAKVYVEVIVVSVAIYKNSCLHPDQMDQDARDFDYTISTIDDNGAPTTATLPVGFGKIIYCFDQTDRNGNGPIDVYSLVYKNFRNVRKSTPKTYLRKTGMKKIVAYFKDKFEAENAFNPQIICDMARRNLNSDLYQPRYRRVNLVKVKDIPRSELQRRPKFDKPTNM
jgi:hypothetical protein